VRSLYSAIVGAQIVLRLLLCGKLLLPALFGYLAALFLFRLANEWRSRRPPCGRERERIICVLVVQARGIAVGPVESCGNAMSREPAARAEVFLPVQER
jgi:hypothetical protein